METQKSTITTENQEQHIKLIDGEFTPIQASDIISSLIKQKINFHKIEGLQHWERDHNSDTKPISNRIKELEKAEKVAKDFIIEMKKQGKKIRIDGHLKISLVK